MKLVTLRRPAFVVDEYDGAFAPTTPPSGVARELISEFDGFQRLSRVGFWEALDGYEPVAWLGSGGLADVFLARDRSLGRHVAIKILRADANETKARTLEEEARSACTISHPNVVTIYEHGRAGTTPYLAMEYVRGLTLRDLLGDGALPAERLFDIAAQVADGLAHAHASGIAHGDLKPENIMVTEEGWVKILDFGLARRRPVGPDGASSSRTTLTAWSGQIQGTVRYMSPEQARGEPIDFRSDQFSFGSILYELAAGRPPFKRPTSVQTLSAIIEDDPPPFASPDRSVALALELIVERCLAKEAGQRYESSRDLARDLKVLRNRRASFVTAGARGRRPSPPLVAYVKALTIRLKALTERKRRAAPLNNEEASRIAERTCPDRIRVPRSGGV